MSLLCVLKCLSVFLSLFNICLLHVYPSFWVISFAPMVVLSLFFSSFIYIFPPSWFVSTTSLRVSDNDIVSETIMLPIKTVIPNIHSFGSGIILTDPDPTLEKKNSDPDPIFLKSLYILIYSVNSDLHYPSFGPGLIRYFFIIPWYLLITVFVKRKKQPNFKKSGSY